MLKSTFIAVAALGLLGTSAFAQDAPVAATPQTAPATQTMPAGDPNEVICKTMEPATGTRIGARRICQTKREWDDIANQSRRMLDKMESQPYRGPGG